MAFLGVSAGGLGARGLKVRFNLEMLNTFEIAARYQMCHAFGLLATVWALSQWPGRGGVVAGWFFVAGTVIFSGSLNGITFSGF